MDAPTYAELLQKVADLHKQVGCLIARVEELTAENQQLREQLEQARREGARQAAPFRRPERKKIAPEKKKKPGRPEGHLGMNRPVPDHVDETITVPLDACPRCGGAVTNCVPVEQYIEEIPAVRPRVIKLITSQGSCAHCGSVASSHSLKSGNGAQASQVHLGPRAIAIATTLNKQHGLSMRKTCRVLQDLCGLKLSPGGLSQLLDRLADRLKKDYQSLFTDLRAGPATYVDETSWWVGGPGHWLWVLTSPSTTVFKVEDHRSSRVVTEVLTVDYRGVLVSDCLGTYDTLPYERKHKCIAHHQKAIREQLDSPGLGDRSYLEACQSFFRTVTTIWKVWDQVTPEQQVAARTNLARQRDELLAREVTQPEDMRIHNRLQKQQPFLLTCLDYPEDVETTNNRAERALRPAVIARKVSCGNKTQRGEETWEVLTSLLVTWWQRGLAVVDQITARAGYVR
jgi:hypothetical protein